jgi:membrane protease YdiL (CAAX protease family)
MIASSALLMISGGLLISILFGGLDSLSQNFSLYDTFISKTDNSVPSTLALLAAYALIPAICEEFIFRGILCYEYESGGVMRAVIFSSLFFALLHFNPVNIAVYLFSGVILALVLYASRSLIGAMLAHLLYNVFGLFGQPALTRFYRYAGSTALFSFLLTFAFLLFAVILCSEASRIYRTYAKTGVDAPYRVTLPREELPARILHTLFPPVGIVCVVVYIIACIFIG